MKKTIISFFALLFLSLVILGCWPLRFVTKELFKPNVRALADMEPGSGYSCTVRTVCDSFGSFVECSGTIKCEKGYTWVKCDGHRTDCEQ